MAPPVAASIDTTHVDAIVRSLALLEERLRAPAPSAGVASNETVAVLEGIKTQLETMTGRMDVMVKESKRASSQAKTTWIFVVLVSIVLIGLAFVPAGVLQGFLGK